MGYTPPVSSASSVSQVKNSTDKISPVRVLAKMTLTGGEMIERDFYVLSINPMTNVYQELTKLIPKDKVHKLCLQII